MRYVRAVLRLAVFLIATLLSYGALLLLLPLKRLRPSLHLRWRNRVFRTWARLLAKVSGMRTTVEGTPPSGRFFLVVNHLSYMDVILLAGHVDAAFVAKADLAAWPLLGRAFGTADTIFINRERRRDVVRVGDRLSDVLDRGLGVLIFPEGTATRGERVLRFKSSLFQLPAELGMPVCCAAIGYRTPPDEPPADRSVCWWGDASFLPHIWTLMQMPYFEARLRFVEKPIPTADRKQLAQRAHTAISERFEPVC